MGDASQNITRMPPQAMIEPWVAAFTSDDPAADFTKINEELRLFDAELARKPQVVLLTKADLPEVEPEVEARLESLRAVVPHGRLLVISAESGLGLPALVRRTRGLLDQLQDR